MTSPLISPPSLAAGGRTGGLREVGREESSSLPVRGREESSSLTVRGREERSSLRVKGREWRMELEEMFLTVTMARLRRVGTSAVQ